jgi:predicted DCC family thiol-disulfide oxidoreductase YuxK
VLRGLTYLVYGAQWAIPVLIFVPAAFRITRSAAAVLMLIHGLLLGLFFSFGLYAWTLVAAAALVIPPESWDAWARAFRPGRVRTIIYDTDCGICLWLSRLAKRLDGRGQLAFQGNDDLAGLWRRGPDGKPSRVELPSSVTAEVVQSTVVVVGPQGQVFTRSRAVAEVIGALALGRLWAWPLRIPGLSHLADILYDVVGKRRTRISELFGLAACGVPLPEDEAQAAGTEPPDPGEVAPAVKVLRTVTGGVREVAVFAVLVAMLAQTGKANALPRALVIPQWKPLQSIAAWPRMLARWDVLAPAPPLEDGMLVVDAQTKAGQSIDLLTNKEPVLDPTNVRGTNLGQLWMDYLYRIRQKEWEPYQKAFRDYLAKGGPNGPERAPEAQATGFDAYWVTDKTPPPGSAPDFPREPGRVKLFTHSRGGKLGAERVPLLRPDVTRPQ